MVETWAQLGVSKGQTHQTGFGMDNIDDNFISHSNFLNYARKLGSCHETNQFK